MTAVIMIENARFAEFLLLLEAKGNDVKKYTGCEMISRDILEKFGVELKKSGQNNNVVAEAVLKAVVEDVQRQMHYEFCVWAQSHGANLSQRK